MKEELDNIIIEINKHTTWSKNAKIRYAFLALGKLVQKDTMFFYTIQNNLLSKEKEDIRYSESQIEEIINTDNLFDYKVVCKNSADMLVYILKNCNIEAEVRKTLVYTTYKDININHYFVIATGDDNKKYFMTLNPDLPNIKLGKKTSKFAYEIKYYIDNDYMDGNNEGKQYYEGDEVDFSILSEEEIEKLDREIGYIQNRVSDKNNKEKMVYTDYFFELLEESYKNNKDYIDYVTHKTEFYEMVSLLLNNNKPLSEVLFKKSPLNKEKVFSLSFKISDISNSTWEDLKAYILNSVISNVYSKYNISSSIDFDELLEKQNYDEIRKTYNKELYSHTDKEKINKMGDLNPFYTMKVMMKLFNIIDIFKNNKNIDSREITKYKNEFNNYLNLISLSFVNKKYLPNDGSLSSTYLTNKIIYAFESIFDIGHKNMFNEIGLAEEVTIIKELLEVILSDIKRDEDLPSYNEQKSPLRNRIISTVFFNKETKEPYYLIYVKNTKYGDNANVIIVYDLTRNELYLDKSPIDIINDYIVIKDADMKLIIEEFTSSYEEDSNFSL